MVSNFTSENLQLTLFLYDKWQVDLFRGFTTEEFPSFGFVYGGQLVGQVCNLSSR